ncbi:MAG: protease family protein [Nocardioidaceae bacterium]|jgi:membrane protease YdiL (CAAX protease family)|nr:protease family protein [Frankiaceae bacterium]MDX6365056.1 protease family protein [Nocardioidaceae bacterium]
MVSPGGEVAVAAFLALAFGIAWLPFIAQITAMAAVGPALMPVAPAIACIVVRRWVTREGFSDVGLRPRLRHWPIYLVALLWPVGAAVVTTLVTLTLGLAPTGYTVPWGASSPSWSMLLLWTVLSVVVSPLILGEELGWRGYLQVRLFPARPLAAALATGLIWGVWHYPLILSSGEPTSSIKLTLITLPVATMTLSVFLGWIRSVTGTVWATSLAHSSNNVTNDGLQRLGFSGRQDAILPDFAIVPCLVGEALTWGMVIAAHALLSMQHQRSEGGTSGWPVPKESTSAARGQPTPPTRRAERYPARKPR